MRVEMALLVHFLKDNTMTEEIDKGEPSLEEHLCNKLGLKTAAGREALKVALANVQILDRKHQDYGPSNINKHGLVGIVVRMDDKFERLATIFKRKRRRAVNESIRDTFRDISNYAIIALLVDSGKWPKE
jgi:hypothetical protein